MSTPLVSVILPAFNAEMFLRESISSILNQSLKNIELIIINDGSTDSTEDIIKSFSDNRIVYLKNTINLGIIKTLNKGIDNAKGKYIARMDADDISMPNRLKRQIEVLENDESIDIVNIKAYILNDSGTFYTKNKGSFAASSNTMRYLQYLRNMIMHPGVMVKKILCSISNIGIQKRYCILRITIYGYDSLMLDINALLLTMSSFIIALIRIVSVELNRMNSITD